MNEEICLSNIVEPLLSWYEENRRILPWREDPTPYHVWISEIMLQQTRVEAVKAYYHRFLKELPDIESLADAEEEKLLKLWEGLGYYNRVRNMQKAARIVMEDYEGNMPSGYDELMKLPGIGSYTAGAISSIAFGRKEAAVDGNVLRVISRITANESDITQEKVKKAMRDTILEILPEKKAGSFNQALMDLGATVCIPNGKPLCDRCPWGEICLAREKQLIEKIPYKPAKKSRKIDKRTVLLIRWNEKLLLHKRGDKGLLAGLYEFPNISGHLDQKQVLKHAKELGLSVLHIEPAEDSVHIFSHIEWHMKAYKIKADELTDTVLCTKKDKDYVFVDHNMIEKAYPIPSAFAAYTPYISSLF